MDDRIDLSRRKVLAGLGTIGVAGAGAGLGTSALFSDTESFDGNMMTAGELDLAVDYVVHEDSRNTYTINSFTEEINGTESSRAVTLNGDGTAMSQSLDDVKPGDSGHSYFCFTIDDNPAYMWACGELTKTAEQAPGGGGKYTEPEPEDDNGEGELEENIEVTMSYCNIDTSDGSLNSKGTEIFSGSLRGLLTVLQGGIPLDGTGVADPTPGSQAAYNGTGNTTGNSDVTNPCICIEWSVPGTVGNIIQGDTLSFDLTFFAQQARNNDGSQNPCVDETFGPNPYDIPVDSEESLPTTADTIVINDAERHPLADDATGELTVTGPHRFVEAGDGNTHNDAYGGELSLDVSYGSSVVVFNVHLDDSDNWPSGKGLSESGYSSTNFSIAFNADPEDDDTYDFQVKWDPDAGLADDPFGFLEVDESGSPNWTSGPLPAGFSASKSGEYATVVVPRSALDKGSTDDIKFGVQAGAGGESPGVSIPESGVYSGAMGFTSDNNNDLTTTLQ